MGRDWPLTGRAEELRFVEAAMRRRDGARGMVLAGASGVGKTRLAWEVLAAAERRGAKVVSASATASARALPLGAFAGVLPSPAADPAGVVAQAAEALVAGAGPGGAVIGVDDAHLLDDLSALLVHQMAVRGQAAVVVTLRSGAPAPDAVTALWKEGHLDRLELQPLSQEETAALLEAVLDGPLDRAAASAIWELTRGNALFLRQLVDSELEALRLWRTEGVWRWSGRPEVSPSLAELVDARMGRLSDPVQQVVNLLALGEPLGVALLGTLADAEAIEQAESAGLVRIDQDGRRLQARLAHPLYGELQRARLGRLRTRRLRGLIATALAATGARRAEDALRRAVLSLDSDLPPDPVLLTRAAQRAIALFDLSLSERLARAAAAAGGFEARLCLAYALSWQNRAAEADAELSALAEYASSDGQRLTVAVPRAANLFWPGRRPDSAQSVLDEAVRDITDPGALRVIEGARAAFHAFLGRPHAAVECARTALASGELPDQALLLASFGHVAGLCDLGRADEAAAVAARAYAAAARSFDAAVPGYGLCDLHMAGLRRAGRIHEAQAIAEVRAAQGAEATGMLQLMDGALSGHAALYGGRLATAIRALREARAGLAPVDTQGFAYRCLMSLTQALAMSGQPEQARRALTRLERERHPGLVLLDPELLLARAWVAAAEGALGEAITEAHRSAELARSHDQMAHEVFALHVAVCFGDRTLAGRLAEAASGMQGPRAAAAAAQAAALAADDGAALLEVSARLADMGDVLAAADAAAQAASAHTRAGLNAAARSAATRAQLLAAACEGARTPTLAAAVRPLPLTGREREIVTLAAQGLSNREIADRLGVSVRTVEGHLYRAYAKLGTTQRTELSALLAPVPPRD
ncbi:LuxR C-terminal-related transcriptional regulator [Streptomyces sp. NPDC001514]